MSPGRKRKADSQLTLSSFFAKKQTVEVERSGTSAGVAVVVDETDEDLVVADETPAVPTLQVVTAAVNPQEREKTVRRDIGQDYDVEKKKWSCLPSTLPKEAKLELVTCHFEPDASYAFTPQQDNEGWKRTFRLQWLRDNPWLRYSPTCNGGFCLPCSLFPAGADQGQLTAAPLTNFKKATTLLQKHREQRSHLDSVVKFQQFQAIVVDGKPDVADQLEGASETQQRQNDEKLKSLLDCIVFCGKQNIPLRGHRNEKVQYMDVAAASSDASANPSTSRGEPQLFDKHAGNPGNFIALLEFRAQSGDAAVLRDFHLHPGGTGGNRVSYLSPRIQNELIDCCGEFIRDKIL